jgi:hypothetical protein
MAALRPESFMFFDDLNGNIQDVQRVFPSSTCVLIQTEANPRMKDDPEFADNSYARDERSTDINFGFGPEHMAMVTFSPLLVFDWDKTLSVIEGVRIPVAQFWEKKLNGSSIHMKESDKI